MATYNGARFIHKQIESLLNQTHPPREIIVSDDNSSDSTVEIIRQFAAQSNIPIIVSVNGMRLGYRSNFMHAASLCKSELIAFCDQDDVWRPTKLEVVAGCFRDDSVFMAFHNAEIVNGDGQSLGQFLLNPQEQSHVRGRLGASPWSFPLGFTQTFRRDLLQLSSLRLTTEDPYATSEHLAHDQWIPILAVAFGRTAYISDVLADYRQHQNNLYGKSAARKSRARMLGEKLLRNSDYGQFSRVVLKIANAFKAAQTELPPSLAAKASQAKSHYLILANYYAARARVYDEKSLIMRAQEWRKLRKAGVYTGELPIQFAKKSVARDLLAGVLLGSFGNTSLRSAFYTDDDNSLTFRGIEEASSTADVSRAAPPARTSA